MSTIETTRALRAPAGRITLTFALDNEGKPTYAVAHEGRTLVAPSALGLELRQGGLLGAGLVVTGTAERSHDERYTLLVGKTRAARDHYNELTVSLAETGGAGRRLDLVFRAYDDGIAFRYALPEQPGLSAFEIVSERTTFVLPADITAWPTHVPSFQSSHEGEYPEMRLDSVAPDQLLGVPLVAQFPDGATVAITEAALIDYAGMYLKRTDGGTLTAMLSPRFDDDSFCVKGSAPHVSPWRVILIGDTPGALVESTLILNLNPPQAIADASWIKTGKAAWSWWSGNAVSETDGGMDTVTMLHYNAFAAEFGLEFNLIDGGWYGGSSKPEADVMRPAPGVDLPLIIQDAREKNVDILLWLHWSDLRDRYDDVFALYEQWGVKGVKVDFFDRDDQEMVLYCRALVENAAKHHLTIDLHGVFKPTGWQRTFPNLLTSEGVLGMEYAKWCARVTPTHNVTLPFTRMLAGHMDYTPGAFRNVTADKFEGRGRLPMAVGTRCHQLAMYVVFESPLQMVSDYPGAYRGQPGAEFLKVVPASWDETRVLAGEIGKYIVVARRKGEAWFVGAMTNETGRPLEVPLSFLGDGAYSATIYADGPEAATEPTQVIREERPVTAGETIALTLAPAGGATVHLKQSQ